MDDCKLRWKSLRDYANRGKNKPSGSQTDATGGELLKRLSFLQASEHQQEFISNISAIKTEYPSPIVNNVNTTVPETQTSCAFQFFGNSRASSQTDFGLERESNSTILESTSTGHINYKSQADGDIDVIGDTKKPKLEAYENRFQEPIATKDDELSCFFRSMEATTRKLPVAMQIKLKRGISALVFDAEEENESYVKEHTPIHKQ